MLLTLFLLLTSIRFDDVDFPDRCVVLLVDADVVAPCDPFSSLDTVDIRCCDGLSEMQV